MFEEHQKRHQLMFSHEFYHLESQNDKLYNNIDRNPKTSKCQAHDVGRGPNIGNSSLR